MPRTGEVVRVLEVDPDLAESLDPEREGLARAAAVARVDFLEPGEWEGDQAYPENAAHFGLLILDGSPLALDGAVKYGFLNFIATTLFLAGLGLLYGTLGTVDFLLMLRYSRKAIAPPQASGEEEVPVPAISY